MFSLTVDKKFIVALHRTIYQNAELYRLISKIWFGLTGEEEGYLKGLVSDEEVVRAGEHIEKCREAGIKIVTWFEEDYPFRAFMNLPPVVYIKGELPDALISPHIGIVGARRATAYGKEMTKKIVGGLSKYNVAIVSGLAYGIDGAAHSAAIEFGMPTVAILGTGMDIVYPKGHRGLSERVVENGALISEFPWGTPPLRHNFPFRNRLISGLSRGVVVVEAEVKSGSLITGRWAADQGREVFAVPGNAGRAMSSGTNRLIKEGAHLLERAQDIAETLGLQEGVITDYFEKKSGQYAPEGGIKRQIAEFLDGGASDMEGLVNSTGLGVKELLPLITEAEIVRNAGK